MSTNKLVWEETWEFRDETPDTLPHVKVVDAHGHMYIEGYEPDRIDHNVLDGLQAARARIQLAAAAPEMARLLLELQWSGGVESGDCCGGGGVDRCCPACCADAPQTRHVPARRVDAYTRIEAHDVVSGGSHEPDCRLVAMLKKAGVL